MSYPRSPEIDTREEGARLDQRVALHVLQGGAVAKPSPSPPPSVREGGGRFDHLVRTHPCLSAAAHVRYGRVHLPVSPACNIQCRFCKRGFNKWEERPGVTRKVLSPEDAVQTVIRARELCPDLTVVGIAGPGDPLSTPHAIEAFDRVHQAFPDLMMCVSTNGLRLPDYAERLVEVGVKSITVTVNGTEPAIVERVISHVVEGNRLLHGPIAARLLIERQLAGIDAASRAGALVKINVVLIPGVNDLHVGEVARATLAVGAHRINLIPLIPQHELSTSRAPTCAELEKAREDAAEYLEVFRHCQHCRADACGIPGQRSDLAANLYDESFPNTFSHG